VTRTGNARATTSLYLAAALALSTGLGVPLPSNADSTTNYRYIESYTGPATAYEIDRGAQKLPPRLGMTLNVGDCVILHEPTNAQSSDNANRMTLMIDGTEARVDAANPKYCVARSTAGADAAVAAIGRMFASVGDLFQRSQNDYYTEHTTTAQTRGGVQEPVLIYLLQPAHPRVAAGQPKLWVAWIDGQPPYDAAVYKKGDTSPLATRTGLQERKTAFDVTLTPGSYELRVGDASGRHVAADFEAIPPAELPQPPPTEMAALQDPSQSLDLRAALYAGWLVQQSPDWRFQAYQGVAGFTPGSDLSRALSFELAGGQ